MTTDKARFLHHAILHYMNPTINKREQYVLICVVTCIFTTVY